MAYNSFALANHLRQSLLWIRPQMRASLAQGAVQAIHEEPVYGHWIAENTVEDTGIYYYCYIAEFKYEDAIDTTFNLLRPTGPLTLTNPLMLIHHQQRTLMAGRGIAR